MVVKCDELRIRLSSVQDSMPEVDCRALAAQIHGDVQVDT